MAPWNPASDYRHNQHNGRLTPSPPPQAPSDQAGPLPYDDDSPVAHPGSPEEREYQIIGVLGDDAIGQLSAVVPG